MDAIILSCLAMLSCFCFYLLRGKKEGHLPIRIIYFMLLVVASGLFFSKIYYVLTHHQVWDFTCFYLYGKVAAGGHDFYSPENFNLVFKTIGVTFSDYEGFIEEVVNVGFPYPPPTILYFAPLGYLSYDVALYVWTFINLFFAAGCIVLLYKIFLKHDKVHGLVLVATLFFLLFPVRLTVYFSQTNFILLFWVLMFKQYENKKYAGIFLSLAFFTKPYVLIFILFLFFKKNWSAILYFCFTAIVICGFTALFFGTEIFYNYLFSNSAKRLPAFVFSEGINQSLHAVLLRAGIISLDKPIVYLAIAGTIMVLAFGYLFFLIQKKYTGYIQPVLLLVALLIYPGTLRYYGVLLLFIIFQFFSDSNETDNQLVFPKWLVIPIVGIFFFLATISLFVTVCFLLVLIIAKSAGVFERKIFQLSTK